MGLRNIPTHSFSRRRDGDSLSVGHLLPLSFRKEEAGTVLLTPSEDVGVRKERLVLMP